jgi:hypothetical protein
VHGGISRPFKYIGVHTIKCFLVVSVIHFWILFIQTGCTEAPTLRALPVQCFKFKPQSCFYYSTSFSFSRAAFRADDQSGNVGENRDAEQQQIKALVHKLHFPTLMNVKVAANQTKTTARRALACFIPLQM